MKENSFWNRITVLGMPLWLYLLLTATTIIISTRGNLLNNMIGALGCALLLGTGLGIIGEHIPIWNQWLGGGILFANLAASFITTFNLLPENTVETLQSFNNSGFLDFFILILIFGSILSVRRKMLIKSLVGYIPTILGGIVGAFLLAALASFLVGYSPVESILSLALPIMGGGNGAGALPMSKMYEAVTGNDPSSWYAASFATLMLGNIMAVLFAAVLNKLGEKYPSLSGNGQLMKSDDGLEDNEPAPVVEKPEPQHYAAALTIALFLFVFANFYAKNLSIVNNVIKSNFSIHQYAFMIIFVALLNILNVIPAQIKAAAQQMQSFFVKHLSFPLLFMVGLGTNLHDYVRILSVQNLIVIFAIVLGACLGTMLVGKLFHFYPIEAAVTAGLCMANAGGSGDVQVLGTAKRMELIPYAQISSRIGGAIILIIASFMFSTFM